MRTLEPTTLPTLERDLKVVAADPPGAGGAHHRYEISGFDTTTNRSRLHGDAPAREVVLLFQNSLAHESGLNGITDEALLSIVADRMASFQAGPYATSHGGRVLALVQAALGELRARTKDRIIRNVADTYAA